VDQDGWLLRVLAAVGALHLLTIYVLPVLKTSIDEGYGFFEWLAYRTSGFISNVLSLLS